MNWREHIRAKMGMKTQKQIEDEFSDKVDDEIRVTLRRWSDQLAEGRAWQVEQEMRHLLTLPRRRGNHA